MASLNFGPFNIPADQWAFSPPQNLPIDAPAGVILQATDPNNQWFTTQGNVKTYGLQVQGYVGADWDNVAPWTGWGWWLFEPGGDPRSNIIVPSMWVPFGRSGRNGVGVGLFLGLSTGLPAGTSVRLGIQTDTAIHLGLQVTTR